MNKPIKSAASAAELKARAERGKVMDALVSEVIDTLVNAADRWQDEKEHENINDYAQLFRAHVEAAGLKLVKMSKRPFGFIVDGFGNGRQYIVYCSSRYAGWKNC